MKKKLVLINPVEQKSGLLLSKLSKFPPLNLAYIAALTPNNWEIQIIDENINEFQFVEADLVGITSFTSTINRAYKPAKFYRDKGTKVVLGGIHASLLPEEVVFYVDSVVIGEAELIWGKVIEDFENKSLQQKYYGPLVPCVKYHILPRRDLLSSEYIWGSIQTSRGCPFDCDFCSVSRYLGRSYRKKNVDDILDDLKSIENEYVFFLDDNLIGVGEECEKLSIDLFKGMIERKMNKKWFMQTSINTGENEEVLKYASRSGCMFALVGIETLRKDDLKKMKKGINLKIGVDNYKKIIDRFHKYGIGVLGAFIIGNDYENKEYYEELADFIVKAGVDAVQISVLTPLPGTDLFNRLQNEQRLLFTDFPVDWSKYRFSHLVHKTIGVSEQDIYWGNNFIKSRIYSPFRFYKRMIKSFLEMKKFDAFYAIYNMNKSYKKSWIKSHYYER